MYISQTKEFDERQKMTFYYRLSDAGRLAAERLIEEGHQKIACVTDKRDQAIQTATNWHYKIITFHSNRYGRTKAKRIEDIEKYGIRQCL